jgi:hypothetical protein
MSTREIKQKSRRDEKMNFPPNELKTKSKLNETSTPHTYQRKSNLLNRINPILFH